MFNTFVFTSLFFSLLVLNALFFFENTSIFFFFINFDRSSFFFFFYNFFIMIMCLYITQIKKSNNNIKLYNTLIITICALNFILFNTSSIWIFFFVYEAIMFPSVLLTYISSPNIRSKFISFYFLFWTQLGSFFFFIVILYLFKSNINSFNNIVIFNNQTFFVLSSLIFFGFGIKIPIFPFHFWLTKTHVEVNTTFSIFLSGVLVKIAIIGLYKFLFLFKIGVFFFLSILIVGALDITLKLFFQVDFKKVVAYCTVFEMNFLTILIFFNNYLNLNLLFLMCILHTTFSAIFFLINDYIYKRYTTRNIYNIPSILNNTPILGYLIIVCVLLFNGLPMTLKFNLELVFFLKIYNFNFFLFSFFYFIQIIFLLNFSRINFFVLCNNNFFLKVIDLNFFEFLIVLILVLLLMLILIV